MKWLASKSGIEHLFQSPNQKSICGRGDAHGPTSGYPERHCFFCRRISEETKLHGPQCPPQKK